MANSSVVLQTLKLFFIIEVFIIFVLWLTDTVNIQCTLLIIRLGEI